VRGREGLRRLSAERVRAELLKLLSARRAVETVPVMAEYGVLTPTLGGVAEFGRFARAAVPGARPVDRLAALAVLVPEDADRLRDRLRLSNDEHERLAAHARLLAALKDREAPLDALAIRRLVADHEPELLARVIGTLRGEPRPLLAPGAEEALGRFASGGEPVPVFPLRGADLVAAGVPRGPEVGAYLSRARALWLEEGCPTGPGAGPALLRRILPGWEGAGSDSPGEARVR
jgi:poly(A) polymerase